MDDPSSRPVNTRRIPWWGHLLLAILSYSLLRFGAPALSGDADGFWADLAGTAAPIAAIGFLLLAANSVYANDPPQKKRDNDDANDGDDD